MKRPALRYHGGKWMLAPWIISNFPSHRVYVEPFGGGMSVLLRKKRTYAEIYNELDGEIVNFFSCARDHGEKLKEQLTLTPFARDEFLNAYEPTEDNIERARRTIIRSFMGFGADAVCGRATGFRSNSNRSGTTPAHDWKNYADVFQLLVDRLRGVVIENKDAKECMKMHDGEDTLHYVDPPYVFDTRSAPKHGYKFEMKNEDHVVLADFLKTLKGAVIVSGYRGGLYDDLFNGWQKIDKSALADGAQKRTETIWMSPNIKSHILL